MTNMSCNCESKCFNSEFVEEREYILNETLAYLANEDIKRTRELHDFIDDFINSQEYTEYVKVKRDITKQTTSTQYHLNDIIVEYQQKQHVITYSLVEEQKKMYAFQKQFEKYIERQKNLEIVKRQENSIKIIREKIEYAKKVYECTEENRLKEIRKKNIKILEKYSEKFGVNLSSFSKKSKYLILNRLKCFEAELHRRRMKRHDNLIKIMETLTYEQKMKKKAEKLKYKTSSLKSRWTEKVIKGMEIVGKHIELIKRESEKETNGEGPLEDEEREESKTEENENKVEMKAKKKSKMPKEKLPKKKKEKSKEKKHKNKPKKIDLKFELPVIPVTNPRQKITPENLNNMIQLIEDFQNFDDILEDKELSKRDINSSTCIDKGLLSKPKTVLFQNFNERNNYCKTIQVSNISAKTKKFRFLKFLFDNPYDEIQFKIEAFGIVKLYAGCNVRFTIHFTPYDNCKPYKGTAVFVSYDVKQYQPCKMELEVLCIPKCADLHVTPSVIQFGRIPIWKVNSKNFKIIKLKNEGMKKCTIYIRKIQDPLDLENILDEEISENSETHSTSTLNVAPKTAELVQDILNECLKNLTNTFVFEENFLTIQKQEEVKLKVFFQRSPYIGSYFEKYLVNVYEGCSETNLDVMSCQEISIFAETTDIFISVVPTQLDFGTCLVNSCYRLCFEVFNNSNNNHAISIRIPHELSDMVEMDVSTFYLRPQSSRNIWVKLYICDYIFKDYFIYFCQNTSILEFPVHLNLVTKNYQDYPTLKIPVYAVLTNSEDLTISTNSTENITNFLNTILLNMGTCSVYETIYTDLSLINSTNITQICGFLNLPDCVKIEPNDGFIKLYPNQRKKVRMYLSPEVKDYPSYNMGNLKNNSYYFKLIVDTVYNIGQFKREISAKKIKSSLELALSEISKKDTDLIQSVLCLFTDIKKTLSAIPAMDSLLNNPGATLENETKLTDEAIQCDLSSLNIQNFLVVETNSRKEIWCRVGLKQPLVELSHQLVEFPDTPCGSYSTMEVSLNTIKSRLEKECDKYRKTNKQKVNVTANFKFTTDSTEISIEPKCGVIKTGQTIKLTLLAIPVVPKEILEQTAKKMKYKEIYELKLEEFQNRQKTLSSKVKPKNKKGTKNSKTTDTKTQKSNKSKKDKQEKNIKSKSDIDKNKIVEESVSNIVITDKELEFDYSDLFPAEMVHWRSLDPYYINANFSCHIFYEIDDIVKQHQLHLRAICRVVQPDFITNLKLQRIDFGKCVVGMSVTKKIMVQNIKYDEIKPKLSVLNPLGPFSIPCMTNFNLPAEHYLYLPLKFTPNSIEKTSEYFEIRSSTTILPLILCGEGLPARINITPEFTVYRLETKSNRLAELQLKIENISEAEVDVTFIKLFEIVNHPRDIPKVNDVGGMKEPKSKKEKQIKNKDTPEQKIQTFSNDLSDVEIETINNNFQAMQEESHFYLNSHETTIFQPNSQNIITIFFGSPELLEKKRTNTGHKTKGKKGKEGKTGKEANNAKPSDKKSKKNEGNKKGGGNIKNQYITQYNIFAGTTFLKSIVLLCSIH